MDFDLEISELSTFTSNARSRARARLNPDAVADILRASQQRPVQQGSSSTATQAPSHSSNGPDSPPRRSTAARGPSPLPLDDVNTSAPSFESPPQSPNASSEPLCDDDSIRGPAWLDDDDENQAWRPDQQEPFEADEAVLDEMEEEDEAAAKETSEMLERVRLDTLDRLGLDEDDSEEDLREKEGVDYDPHPDWQAPVMLKLHSPQHSKIYPPTDVAKLIALIKRNLRFAGLEAIFTNPGSGKARFEDDWLLRELISTKVADERRKAKEGDKALSPDAEENARLLAECLQEPCTEISIDEVDWTDGMAKSDGYEKKKK